MLTPILEFRKITDSVIVSVSLGKDSLVSLDLCKTYIKNVYAVFGYLLKDLDYQQDMIKKIKKRYNIQVLQIPAGVRNDLFHAGYLNYQRLHNIPDITDEDFFNTAREYFGVEWIARGFKAADSVMRMMSIKKYGYIRKDTKIFMPVANFNKKALDQYIKEKAIEFPEEYYLHNCPGNLGDLTPYSIYIIKYLYPNDYKKICKRFPKAEAAAAYFEKYEIPKLHNRKEAEDLIRIKTDIFFRK